MFAVPLYELTKSRDPKNLPSPKLTSFDSPFELHAQIWKIHKRVCGGMFQWPALQAEERAEMIELSTKPVREPNGTTSIWRESFVLEGSTNPADAEIAFKVCSAIVSAFERDPRLTDFSRREQFLTESLGKGGQAQLDNQYILFLHRSDAFRVKVMSDSLPDSKSIRYGDFRKWMGLDPLGFLAYFQRTTQFKLLPYSKTEWYSELQHRTLILVGLMGMTQRMLEESDHESLRGTIGLLSHATAQLVKFAQSQVHRSNSEVAKSILQVYLPALSSIGGIEPRAEDTGESMWSMLTKGQSLAPATAFVLERSKGENVVINL